MLGNHLDQGPVVYWRPFDGARHALEPSRPPRDGQTRVTLCGITKTLPEPTERDWIDPTCETCWLEAKALLHERQTRRRAELDKPSSRT